MVSKPLHDKVTIDVLVGSQDELEQLRLLHQTNVFYLDTIVSEKVDGVLKRELQLSCIRRTDSNFQYTGKSTGVKREDKFKGPLRPAKFKGRSKSRTLKRKV